MTTNSKMIVWPEYNGSKPSTTGTAVLILQEVLNVAKLDTSIPEEKISIAQELLLEITKSSKIYRQRYDEIYIKIVEIQSLCTIDTCIQMCHAGITKSNELFLYKNVIENDDDENTTPPTTVTTVQSHYDTLISSSDSTIKDLETMEYINPITYDPSTNTTSTDTSTNSFPLASPFVKTTKLENTNNDSYYYLRGNDAIEQVQCWYKYGCLEESAANHACEIYKCPIDHILNSSTSSTSKSDYVQNEKTIFCMLGITSELAPTKTLLQHVPNAHVIGISRKPQSIIDWYTQLCNAGSAAPGTKLQVCAADMIGQYPEISKWIVQRIQQEINKNLTCTYKIVILPMGYMDGEANVRLCIAMDQIIMYCINKLTATNNISDANMKSSAVITNFTVGYWISPSTVYMIPKKCVMTARNILHQQQSSWLSQQKLLSTLSLGRFLQPTETIVQALVDNNNDDNTNVGDDNDELKDNSGVVFSAVTKLQGPNYLLSKTLQQWRCMVLSSVSSTTTTTLSSTSKLPTIRVLAPQAPPSRTISVTHSPEAHAGIEGMPYVAPPMITFSADTCSTLMTAIMLNQLRTVTTTTPENDVVQEQNNKHLLTIFWDGSVHGGIWNCPYDINSLGVPSYLVGKYLISTGQDSSYPAKALIQRPS